MQIPEYWRSRWWMPSFSLFLGLLMLGAFVIGGDPGMGIAAFGVMAGMAALFAFGRRSETLQGLGGPGYGLLGAIAGIAYIVAVAVLRWRS
jgi:hypothetical protein